jgi:hypothetical protein
MVESEIELIERLHIGQMRQLQPDLEIALAPSRPFCFALLYRVHL